MLNPEPETETTFSQVPETSNASRRKRRETKRSLLPHMKQLKKAKLNFYAHASKRMQFPQSASLLLRFTGKPSDPLSFSGGIVTRTVLLAVAPRVVFCIGFEDVCRDTDTVLVDIGIRVDVVVGSGSKAQSTCHTHPNPNKIC